jgi:hypothetical protein
MKKRHGLIALCAASLLGVPLTLSLASCGGDGGTVTPGPDDKVTSFNISITYNGEDGQEIKTNPSSIDIYLGESASITPVINAPSDATSDWIYDSDDTDVAEVDNVGNIVVYSEGETEITVTAKNSDDVSVSFDLTVNPSRKATGAFNYAADDYYDKLDVLSKLEGYAIDNHLTGLTLFENGGKAVYSKRINFPTKNGDYVTGFGFGVQSEGSLNHEYLSGIDESTYPNNPEWAYYYQGSAATGITNICYLDDSGSVTSDLYSYVASGLYSTVLNSNKDGYVWTNSLAKSDPIPVKIAGDGTVTELTQGEIDNSSKLFSNFKIYVKTGADGVKYSTLSTNSNIASFNNRSLELEDYVTAYRNLLTKRNDYYRGQEMTSLTSTGTLKGALNYYKSTGDTYTGTTEQIEKDKELFNKNVGLKTGSDENGDYLVFTLNSPLSVFYAKYNLGGNLMMPVPQDFLNVITPVGYGKGIQGSYGVLDSILSLGPYNIEKFDTTGKGEFVFKNNPNFQSIMPGYYLGSNVPGVHLTTYDTSSDSDLIIKEFKKGKLDAASLTKNTLNDDFTSIGVVKQTEGDSTFKLNINSCTQEEWEYLFGENGVVNQNNKSQYRKVKPFMGNSYFLNGISYSINREEYAKARGVNPSQDYFAPSYLWDPEGSESAEHGISSSYSKTTQHKNNLKNYFPETYGYNLEAAKKSFALAINEMVNKGQITLPYRGELDIQWMNTGDTNDYGTDIEKYIETAVNSIRSDFQIDVVNIDGTTNYQDVYNKMKYGQYDLAFGSISGMTLDPLGFLEVLKSDNSSGFTLNFGTDTSVADGGIIYDKKSWSFDGLWTAANKGAIIDTDGLVVKNPVTVDFDSVKTTVGTEYTTYTMLVDVVEAGGAEINLSSDGALYTISFKDRSTDTATDSSYTGVFEEGEFTVEELENGQVKITAKIPNSFTTTLLNNKEGTISSANYTGIELTCNYELSIVVGDENSVTTVSTFTIDL